ncbi:unnamed protein product [Pleuronectes platessa]|uniref:Uncharacterized protein n=1 Tax=Pleuronectes platessa TaxID=8262 RepID=A0A9N7Z6P4_PLEPL|nr:unnamed protein product [Pleuronectes platessa]
MFIFVVKPLGTCRGWGSSRSVALRAAGGSVCGTGRSSSGVTGGGGFLSLVPRGGVHRRRGRRAVGGDRVRGQRRPLWTRVGPFSRITSATATAGGTLCSRAHPAVRLGWRLVADLELVRTRGIRLFN